MRMSPDSSRGATSWIMRSTTAAGTMSQTARGLVSFLTKSSSEAAPVAPSLASPLTASAETS
jgi:hypothetical protein